jgi:hypothetical protein
VAGKQGPRRYAVLHRYASGEHGPWEMGTTVELTPAQAAWVNRDSPGTLAEVKPGVKLTTGQPVPPSKLLGEPDPEPEPEPAEAEGSGEPQGDAPVASTTDEGAQVATGPRGRTRGGRAGRS